MNIDEFMAGYKAEFPQWAQLIKSAGVTME